MRALARLERLGRWLLIFVVARLLRVRPRAFTLPDAPRILVVRIDERVGNMVMLTPLLATLARRFPQATVDLLGSPKPAPLVASHPAIASYLVFRKRALFAAEGPLWAPFRLRRRRYDLAVDATNPTDPSKTQAILVRLSGARHTLGFDRPPFSHLYSLRAPPGDPARHEIELRLALLDPLPGHERLLAPSLALPAAEAARVAGRLLPELTRGAWAIVNVGARLSSKQLGPRDYGALAGLLAAFGLTPVFTFGPRERELAAAAREVGGAGVLAPPTDLTELAALMRAARAVVSCDTGPMHVAVAVGTPTCGIFPDTDPRRYGYTGAPHSAVDARSGFGEAELAAVERWLRAAAGAEQTGAGGSST